MKKLSLMTIVLLAIGATAFGQAPGGKPTSPVKTLLEAQQEKYTGIWDGEVNDGKSVTQVALGFGKTATGVFGGELGVKSNGNKGGFQSVLVLENGSITMTIKLSAVVTATFSGGFTGTDKIGGKIVMSDATQSREGTWTATKRKPGAAPAASAASTPPPALDMDGYIAKLKTISGPDKNKNVVTVATECITKFPSSIPCHTQRAFAYLDIYKAKPIDIGNMKVMGKQDQDPDWQRAVDDMTKIASIAPGNAEYLVGRAMVYLDGWNSDPKELAIADLKKALELDPNHAAATRLLKKAKNELASSLGREASDLSVSAAFVREKDPKEADARLVRAIAMMNKVIEYSRDYLLYNEYSRRAGMYRDLKKYDLAIADFTKVISLKPDYADAYNERASIYRKQKKNQLALADYEALLARPDNSDTKYGKISAFLGKAELQLEAGQLDAALTGFNAVLANNPEYSAAYLGRGQIFLKKGDLINAKANFDKYLSLSYDRTHSERYLAELGIEPYKSKYPDVRPKKIDSPRK